MKYLIAFSLYLFCSINCSARMIEMPTEIDSCFYLNENIDIDVNAFLSLTPKKIKEQTGQRLTIKQALALKAAQKKVKKEIGKTNNDYSGKSQATALILAIFLGWLGVHRFYLGYNTLGVLMLMSLGGCFVLAIVDMILIATGELNPKNEPYTDSLD